jgi:hypothetical protein
LLYPGPESETSVLQRITGKGELSELTPDEEMTPAFRSARRAKATQRANDEEMAMKVG